MLTVGDLSLHARQAVVISTGTRAVVLDSLAGVDPWTSREATSATEVPRRLVILGGGVVGCEMADAWRSLGTEEVTLDEWLVQPGDFVSYPTPGPSA